MAIFSTIGSIIAGNKQAKAVDKASDAQAAASREAIALQKDIYNKNIGLQTPYLNTGNAAMAQINALLGLQVPQTPVQGLPTASPATGSNTAGPSGGFFGSKMILDMWRQRLASGQANLEDAPEWVRQSLNPSPAPGASAPVPTVTQPTAEQAYEQFKNYTGYQTRLDEANNAFNSAYAAKGSLQSGAALQALAKMNQNYASGEFGNYMGYLGGQQQLGPGAANAMAGVGTNYANNAGNIAMQQGQNYANAAITKGNIAANTTSAIAGGLGQIAGMFMPTSFSDRRLKIIDEVLGKNENGLTVYRYRLKSSPNGKPLEGFMADEVEAAVKAGTLPAGAFIPDYRGTGYAGVNYALTGSLKIVEEAR